MNTPINTPTFYLALPSNPANNVNNVKLTKPSHPRYHPCRAAGVLFYTFKKGKLKVLLQSSHKGWVDLGGKTEHGDVDIFMTAAREASEESNCALITKTPLTTREDVLPLIGKCTQAIRTKLVHKSSRHIYIKQSKYLLFLVPLSSFEARNLKQSKLLDRELFFDDPLPIGQAVVATSPNKPDVTINPPSTHDAHYKRTMGWKSLNTFQELVDANELHPRLRHSRIYHQLQTFIGT